MDIQSWVKGGLQSVVAALSTAPPILWQDERVIAVASSTFLLYSLESIASGREKASREELAEAFENGFTEIETQLREAADAARVDAAKLDELRGHLVEDFVKLALRVDALGMRIEYLDQDMRFVLERLAALEKAAAEPPMPELSTLRDRVYKIPLFERNALQDRLDQLDRSELNIVIGRVGFDRDNLRGETKKEIAGELVDKCRRTGRLGQLVREVETELSS